MSSDPPITRSPLAILEQHQQPLLPLAAAAAVAGGVSAPTPSSSVPSREYRKGNWTVQETLILIIAKRLDDDRRSRGGSSTSSEDPSSAPRSAEQRWKWVENYCWKQGCFRSQNQCNDKWDNLLRDYKKVRDYESRIAASSASTTGTASTSYWSLERHERKERNLPTNLAFEVYESLTDVLSRRATLRSSGGAAAAPHPRPLSLPPVPPPPPPPPTQTSVSGEMTPEGSSETEGSGGGGGGSPWPPRGAKRRRGLGSSVVRGAEELARTLMACEERKDRRHRDLMELEERRLRMEENRTEMNRQAVAGLIAAVNGLSAAVHSLVADHRSGHGR